MNEPLRKPLTADEVGAFVAQWAEQRPVTAEELAAKLDIDSNSVASLLNQSRGRSSMAKWTSQGRSSSSSQSHSYAPVAAIGAVFLLIGGLVTFILFPRKVRLRTEASVLQAGRPMGPAATVGFGGLGAPMAGGPHVGPGDPNFAPVQPPGFRPVPGDGDPAQRVGLGIGADIAKVTSGNAGGPSAAGGALPASRITDGDGQGLLVFSATDDLRTKGVRIPNDVVIWIRTTAAVFRVAGQRTSSEAAAEALKVEDFLPSLGALMTFAMVHSPPTAAPSPPRPGQEPEIKLQIGTAFRNYPIDWSPQNRDRLLSMFAIPATNEAQSVIQPFLDTVHTGGKNLFRVMPLIPATPPDPMHLGAVPPPPVAAANPAAVKTIFATADLQKSGIVIPNDIVFWIRTPSATVTAVGKKTGNVAAAQKVKADQLVPVLNGLLNYALEHSPPSASQTGRATLVMTMGDATLDVPMDWSANAKVALGNRFEGWKSTDAGILIRSFLIRIQAGGKYLFGQPPAMWRSAPGSGQAGMPGGRR